MESPSPPPIFIFLSASVWLTRAFWSTVAVVTFGRAVAGLTVAFKGSAVAGLTVAFKGSAVAAETVAAETVAFWPTGAVFREGSVWAAETRASVVLSEVGGRAFKESAV